MANLKVRDVLGLGGMTFALFLGAGNIIFPPSFGLAAGESMWRAALGFLLSGVGLPLLTVVALARRGGSLAALAAPLGQRAGMLFAITVYLAIGPLFATPRTALVSFEMGLAPFAGHGALPLALYSLGYFAAVLFFALSPGRLLEKIGQLITPVLLIGLLLLGGAAILAPASDMPRGFSYRLWVSPCASVYSLESRQRDSGCWCRISCGVCSWPGTVWAG